MIKNGATNLDIAAALEVSEQHR
ncbi:MAG: hypothetical protein NVV73_03405 [Cellvibrionaceae bacterium]|nr:hypothetical protein [Cellvibrionaceae bacterium]